MEAWQCSGLKWKHTQRPNTHSGQGATQNGQGGSTKVQARVEDGLLTECRLLALFKGRPGQLAT